MAVTSVLSLLLLVVSTLSAPADEPIRIDLPVYDQPQTDTEVLQSEPLDSENYPGGNPVQNNAESSGGNFVTYKLQAASNLLGPALNAKAGVFYSPVPTLESAVEETEGYGSKTLSFKENIQGFVAGLFQPKPIVDTISEEEKYGNSGDKFYSAGKALVGGAEGISNFVNSALEVDLKVLIDMSEHSLVTEHRAFTVFNFAELNNEQSIVIIIFSPKTPKVPGAIFKQISRAATEKLNNIGGKLIGL